MGGFSMFCTLRFYQGIAIVTVLACLLSGAKLAHAQLSVIGNWEGGTGDGWFDWQDGLNVDDPSEAGRYTFNNTIGATIGNYSIGFTGSGYDQDLSVKLQNNYPTDPVTNHPEWRPLFFENKAFAIDITYGPYTATQNATGGYQQMYEMDLNAPGYGFKDVFAGNAPIASTEVGFTAGVASPAQTLTLSYNYGALIGSGATQIATNASYVEFILATNGDSTHDNFYFDNARFYTPGDMNNDGHVDAGDIKAMELALTNPTAYKNTYFNGNSNFVLSDLATLGDVNGDGKFNNADVQALSSYLIAGNGSTSTVPEPASLTLLGFATATLLWAARKKRK